MCESLLGFCLFYNLTVYPYLKTVIIMANFELKFRDHIDSTTIKVESIIQKDLIQIIIENEEVICIIDLDKSTAIKFAKTLRTEINKIAESEASNG